MNKKEILEIIKKYNIEIIEDTMEINETGVDFRVAFAKDKEGNDWVLRFPRRPDVMAETGKEKNILEFLISQTDFEVPNWQICESDLIAYKRLKGEPMGIIDMEIQNYRYAFDIENLPPKFIKTLGAVMAQLHQIKPEAIEAAGFTYLDASELRVDMKRRMDAIKSEFEIADAVWNRWQSWLENDEIWPKKTAFTHGDLHPAHIIINENNEVTGLIDWTEARVYDSAIDFTVLYKIFGNKLQSFIDAYAEAGGYTWPGMLQHIEEVTFAYPLFIAEFALKSGLPEYREMAQMQLQA